MNELGVPDNSTLMWHDTCHLQQNREEYREGFFLYYDRLWEIVNLRKDTQLG